MESQDRRREARRRRILEHAENRIKRITGEVEKINCAPVYSNELPLMNGITSNDIQQDHKESHTYGFQKDSLDDKADTVDAFSLATHENINNTSSAVYCNSTIGTFLAIKLHIILLGIFVCIFFTNTSAFLPFVVLEAINVVFVLIENEKKSVGLFGALLLASGISAEKIAFVFRYMQAFNTVRDDLAIYLFTVVIIHAILEKVGFSKIEV